MPSYYFAAASFVWAASTLIHHLWLMWRSSRQAACGDAYPHKYLTIVPTETYYSVQRRTAQVVDVPTRAGHAADINIPFDLIQQ